MYKYKDVIKGFKEVIKLSETPTTIYRDLDVPFRELERKLKRLRKNNKTFEKEVKRLNGLTMSMEEYEACLRKDSEMLDEESRKEGQVANEHWIDAMDEALKRVERIRGEAILYMEAPSHQTERIFRTIRNALNGIRSNAAMLLPKDHEKYMDQQGDEPNKKPKQEG